MWSDVSRRLGAFFPTLILLAALGATPVQAQVAPEVLENAESLVSEVYDMVSA
ncbi:MAG: hypothetical protein GTO46_14035, partial [Gemmatimonadetes bacterium]|nr:hypothetical protein [Gemmatimonadota bacterium]NIO32709.1 hypothetical protein [Gemmatimonadota bacterium]